MTIDRLLELHRLSEHRIANLEKALHVLGELTGNNTDTTNAKVVQLQATIADVQDALAEHLAGE